jgi:hypothetical protein
MSPVVKARLSQFLGLAAAGLGAAWLAPIAIEPPLFALTQGALLVSKRLAVPDTQPTSAVHIPGCGAARLYCYRI